MSSTVFYLHELPSLPLDELMSMSGTVKPRYYSESCWFPDALHGTVFYLHDSAIFINCLLYLKRDISADVHERHCQTSLLFRVPIRQHVDFLMPCTALFSTFMTLPSFNLLISVETAVFVEEPADVHERHCHTPRCQFCVHKFFPMLILPLEKKNSWSNSCIYF